MWVTSEKDDYGTFKQFSFAGNDDYLDCVNVRTAKSFVEDYYDNDEHSHFRWIRPGFDVEAYKSKNRE